MSKFLLSIPVQGPKLQSFPVKHSSSEELAMERRTRNEGAFGLTDTNPNAASLWPGNG